MSEQALTATDAAELDVFIDHLWLEDGLAKNTLESYRLDLSAFSLWLTKQNKQLLKQSPVKAPKKAAKRKYKKKSKEA